MKLLRAPLVIIGLLLTVIGFGNIYTGRTKADEYALLLRTRSADDEGQRHTDAPRLEPRLRSTLLNSLAGPQDPLAATRAKLDFYSVVHSGGRLLTLMGMFCVVAGVIHFWYRETRGATLLADGK